MGVECMIMRQARELALFYCQLAAAGFFSAHLLYVWMRVANFSFVDAAPRCTARVFRCAAAAALGCEGGGRGAAPGIHPHPPLPPRIACPRNRQPPSLFNRGPFPELTARNVSAERDCGLCLTHLLPAFASQDAACCHDGSCWKAASSVRMNSVLVSVPPSQASARIGVVSLLSPRFAWGTAISNPEWRNLPETSSQIIHVHTSHRVS